MQSRDALPFHTHFNIFKVLYFRFAIGKQKTEEPNKKKNNKQTAEPNKKKNKQKKQQTKQKETLYGPMV